MQKLIGDLVARILINDGVRRLTKIVSPKSVVRATRRTYKHGQRKGANVEVLVTIGRPNCRERAFIKARTKAGETFPVRKLRVDCMPNRRRSQRKS